MEAVLGSIGMVWPSPHALSDEDREALSALASLAALAVDRARLASTASERSEWFERMAHTDPLTGLANERTVARILELELARAGRQGSELSLAMFDVDDFRATNEQGGHVAGDEVLRQVAAVLAESVRLVDTVGRIGGDEFVLVAPGSAGAMVARRVLEGIAALPAVAGRTVSVSAGVGPLPGRRHRLGVADRGRDGGARTGQGRGRRVGARRRREAGRRERGPAARRAAVPSRETGVEDGAVAPGPGFQRERQHDARPRSAGRRLRSRRCPVSPTLKPPSGFGTPSLPMTHAS